ncbi:MAG: potassium channel family protein [Candidatus Korobacteraceae bacterium]
MPKLSSLLLKIPDEFKPIAALSIGAFILVVLVLFHGISLHRILVLHRRGVMRLQSSRPHLWDAEFLFGGAVFLMLGLHIFEIATWAFMLVHMGLILRAADALYFCANAYTTLGYGVVDLGPSWRNISPIIAISGLFTFAWTTSSLVGMVTRHLSLLEQLEIERRKEIDMREAEREAAWEAYAGEETAESATRAEARKRGATASFFERCRIWREERRKEEELRTAVNKQADELRHHERLEEEKLGQELTSGDAPEAKDKK